MRPSVRRTCLLTAWILLALATIAVSLDLVLLETPTLSQTVAGVAR
ncbi:MAG: hypothetical protein ACOCXA_02750 [Planctomycetota bacterium]